MMHGLTNPKFITHQFYSLLWSGLSKGRLITYYENTECEKEL